MNGFGRGICAIISSDFSKLIMSKDIPKTKRYAWLSTTIMLVFALSLCSILYPNRVFLAEILINDKDIHPYIEQQFLAFLAYFFAIVFIYTIYGFVRGLGKEKTFVPIMIFLYALSIFVFVLLYLIDVGQNSIYYGIIFGEAFSAIVGIVIIGLADWRKEADDIVKQSE